MDETFVEVSAAKFRHLLQHEVTHLVKALSLTRIAHEEELPVVRTDVVEAVESVDFLGLYEIEVRKAGLSVVEDVAHDVADLASEVVV